MDKLKKQDSFLHRMSMQEGFRAPRDQMLIKLAPPAPHDVMYERKQDLLHQRRLPLTYNLKRVKVEDITDEWLDGLLEAARILQLTEAEWYFVEDDGKGPFSPRNEIEALGALELTVRALRISVGAMSATAGSPLAKVHSLVLSRLNARNSNSSSVSKEPVGAAEAELSSWAAKQGIKSLIQPANFEGMGRGAAASTNISTGDLVLEIPQEALISEDVALESDLGAVLKETPELSGETMSLLWSMKERHNKTSRFAPFFESLPESFHTGLGFGIAGLKALEGTLVVEELTQAREHLRSQFDSLFPALSDKHPELFPANIYCWDEFLWACQLWYSYGMKVKFPTGTVQTCLVPFASLLNHSIHPHVTHFSRINESTNTLQLFALRECKAGEQCFLSYGALQNSDLLTFYGFLVKDNPYDIIPIDLDLNEICEAPQQLALIQKYDVLSSHMVRGFHRLPTQLIAALRVACMEDDDFVSYSADPRRQMISPRNEKDVYESLLSTVESLLEPLEESDESSGLEAATNDSSQWDVLLAQQFNEGQRKVLESVRSLCVASLEAS
ncbi:unnamed protein product [Calypogeia fissa]